MGIQDGNLVFTIVTISLVLLVSGFSSVSASHVPTDIDTDDMWSPPSGFIDGYLEFINPTEHPDLVGAPFVSTPPGAISTEEYTGYTKADGTDVIESVDNDETHGDKADFDWVQENRDDENTSGSGVNHPAFFDPVSQTFKFLGAMGWTIGTPEMSAHEDEDDDGNKVPHDHSLAEDPQGTLPELDNDACPGMFEFVDVFSIISEGEDSDIGTRNQALDYVVGFGNSMMGVTTIGIPTKVFVPGWVPDLLSTSDNYVARWVPAVPGQYDLIAIEPPDDIPSNNPPNAGHDEVVEIDAVKCYISSNAVGGEMMPIDTTAVLIAGIQTNGYSIFGTFVVIGAIAFGALVISVKRKPN